MRNKETILVAEDDKTDALFLERALPRLAFQLRFSLCATARSNRLSARQGSIRRRLVHLAPDLALRPKMPARRVPSSRLESGSSPASNDSP